MGCDSILHLQSSRTADYGKIRFGRGRQLQLSKWLSYLIVTFELAKASSCSDSFLPGVGWQVRAARRGGRKRQMLESSLNDNHSPSPAPLISRDCVIIWSQANQQKAEMRSQMLCVYF